MTVTVVLLILAVVFLIANVLNKLEPWPAILCLILLETLRLR